ncbi:MAG: HlyD family efflux transporter periplasmic adaptor subunit [Bacteroidetes bacterium]|nr:HlyD family efflux transporter periplasmic adaptor subunit [Bacteroidota bacterium]
MLHFEKEIEIKTEEVNELLTAVPKWIVRRGISLIFLVMVLALAASVFIRYPDTLSAKMVITTNNPPATLVAKSTGKIVLLNVKNGQAVKKEDVLMVIESAADYHDVLQLKKMLDSLQLNLRSKKAPGDLPYTSFQLGDITYSYIAFLKSYSDFKIQSEIDPQQKEIGILDKELLEYEQLQFKYETQEATYKDEFALVEKDFNRYNTLLQSSSISTKEFEDKKRDYLVSKRNYETLKITGINNKLNINNLEKNKLQLQILSYQENEKIKSELRQSIQNLLSGISIWEQAYLLKAPLDGTVSLFNYWSVNQNIKTGDEVLSIVPAKKLEIIAKLFLPVQNSGKLKTGQTVNIRLDNYAYQEYGILKGKIKHISEMPQKEVYAVEVELPDRLTTSYHKQLDYKEEMQGTADIITEELSVFDRIFYQLRKIIYR